MNNWLKTIFWLIFFKLYLFNQLSSCQDVIGLDSPVDIFNDYFQQFFGNMDTQNNKTTLTLVSIHEQVIDVKVYRFIFKLVNGDNKVRYIGILSMLSNEELKKAKPKHKIIRDSQRLLGVYDVKKDDKAKCDSDLKVDFWNNYIKNPLTSPLTNQNQQQVFPQQVINNQNQNNFGLDQNNFGFDQNNFGIDQNLLQNIINSNPIVSNENQKNDLISNFLTDQQKQNSSFVNTNVQNQNPLNMNQSIDDVNIDHLLQQLNLNDTQLPNIIQNTGQINNTVHNNLDQQISQQDLDNLFDQFQNTEMQNLLLNNQFLQKIIKMNALNCWNSNNKLSYLISLIVITLSFIIISGLKKFNCDSINQKKFLCLSFAIIAQSCFYIFNEFSEISFYSIIEQFTRDILFFFAFYFFLKDLNVLTDKQKTYKLCMALISTILTFSIIELFMRLYYNQDCLLNFIRIKVAMQIITIISFLIVANNWIKSLIEEFFFQMSKKKSRNQQRFQQNISFIDRNYLVSQLFKLKILVFIYFFTQCYKITKQIFFLVLNSDYSENQICLSLYGQEKDVQFYSFFNDELEYFKAIKLGEYVFRLIFCYLIPVAIILLIMRGEKMRAKGISESLTTDSVQKISQTDLIKGLNFNYDDIFC